MATKASRTPRGRERRPRSRCRRPQHSGVRIVACWRCRGLPGFVHVLGNPTDNDPTTIEDPRNREMPETNPLEASLVPLLASGACPLAHRQGGPRLHHGSDRVALCRRPRRDLLAAASKCLSSTSKTGSRMVAICSRPQDQKGPRETLPARRRTGAWVAVAPRRAACGKRCRRLRHNGPAAPSIPISQRRLVIASDRDQWSMETRLRKGRIVAVCSTREYSFVAITSIKRLIASRASWLNRSPP